MTNTSNNYIIICAVFTKVPSDVGSGGMYCTGIRKVHHRGTFLKNILHLYHWLYKILYVLQHFYAISVLDTNLHVFVCLCVEVWVLWHILYWLYYIHSHKRNIPIKTTILRKLFLLPPFPSQPINVRSFSTHLTNH